MTNFEMLKNDINLMAGMLMCPYEDENGIAPERCGVCGSEDYEHADDICRECAKKWLESEAEDDEE
ncbi:MAG: hypothetical protein LUD03_01620 [Firmicutes bacterium]|nr:hypothetical protein [Bacillota bacterium]